MIECHNEPAGEGGAVFRIRIPVEHTPQALAHEEPE